ncbi:uncharacterized protein LOC135844726 [Planococcus citri]|uniref:uncharacterized protein LOC135844726 n=1 Tax=Planococcus citri TaxID=170843 RepID=UPI0031F8AE58
MEEAFDSRLNQLVENDKNVTGLLVTDKQGLCIKTVGNAKEESSGVISAINDLAAKLEPNRGPSTVIMESDTKCCVIYSGKNMNAAVFKNVSR